jgi:hypothetical protein
VEVPTRVSQNSLIAQAGFGKRLNQPVAHISLRSPATVEQPEENQTFGALWIEMARSRRTDKADFHKYLSDSATSQRADEVTLSGIKR